MNTPDDFERNLDTQARRLAELEKVINAALNDQHVETELSQSPRFQTYNELTSFNRDLRADRGWNDVDLDGALSETQREAWVRWQQKNRLNWNSSDFLAIGAVATIGLLCAWFDNSIDHAVRDRLGTFVNSALGARAEANGKQLPIDYMGPGFGGRAHRIKSAGHDLARPFEALRQIMEGEFSGIDWRGGQRTQITDGNYRGDIPLIETASRLVQHLFADVVTPMSLPIPGMSLLYESNSEELRDFALHAYSGLGEGTGWNVRSGIVTPSMTVVITEVLIRTYVHAEAFSSTGTLNLDLQQRRKQTELLLAAHGLVSAISLAKWAAQVAAHCLAGNYIRAVHPSGIRHANIPALLRTGALAATTVQDMHRISRIPSARSWDELTTDSVQPWQLEFVEMVEAVGEEASSGWLPTM